GGDRTATRLLRAAIRHACVLHSLDHSAGRRVPYNVTVGKTEGCAVTGARRGRKPDERRRGEMARLRKGGLTHAEIGRRPGRTRQCVRRTLLSAGKASARPVVCRACGAVVVRPLPGNQPAPAALCPACLVRHPAAPFADRLRTFRLARGLTRAELAR